MQFPRKEVGVCLDGCKKRSAGNGKEQNFVMCVIYKPLKKGRKMKYDNKNSLSGVFFTLVLCTSLNITMADLVNGQNWADNTVSYTGGIQNYAGILMDGSTEFWILGPSDADQDSNGYAFDDVDQDTAAGWRGGSANQEIVVGFDSALTDVPGDDLVIRLFCGPSALAGVYVSEDNSNWTLLGTVAGGNGQVPGKPGFLYDAAFDFSGIFSGDVSFVKVSRINAGEKTGMFFDSFASVPEPLSAFILGVGGLLVRKRI